jgi:hypothetical protein
MVQGSCLYLPPPWLPSPPGGFRLLWTRCWAEPRLLEPFWLRLRCWGGGGPAEGCRVMAGSSDITLCTPAEGFQLAAAEQSLFPTKSSRILTGLGGLRTENNPGTKGTAFMSNSTRLTWRSAASSDSSSAHMRDGSSVPMYSNPSLWCCWIGWTRRLKKENIMDAPVTTISL